MQITRKIKIDFARESHTVKIFARQGDINSRYVEIEPLENGMKYQIPDGVIARFAAKKPDGTEIFNDYPTISENIITVVLTEQTLAAAGDVECDIQLYKEESGQVLKAQTFVVRVRPDVLKNAKSSNEYQSYEAALLKIEKSKLQAVEAVEAAKNALTEAEAALAKVDEAQVAYDQMMNDFGDLGGIAVSKEEPESERVVAWIDPSDDEKTLFMTSDDIAQELGDSEEKVLSQKAVTEEFDKINEVVFPPVIFRGEGQFKGGWVGTALADDITLETGKSYLVTAKPELAPDSSAYFQVKKQDSTNIVSAQIQGLTEYTEVITPLNTEENCIISITSASFIGKCYVTLVEIGTDNVTKASEQVEQLENGYKTFDGAFVHGYNYGTFESYEKYKVVSVSTFKFDYNITVKCDHGYAFIIVYFDETGQYLSTSGWFEHGESYVVNAGSIFRINIASKDESGTVDIEETKTKAQYTTKIESKISKIESKISKIESNLETEIRKFDFDDFAIGERYDYFDYSIKIKVTNVNSFVFDYDVFIKGTEGYTFLVLTYDENDKYKTYSGWKVGSATHTVPAGVPFRVSIAKVPEENVTNIAEYVNAISYFTETGSNIIGLKNDMKTKLSNSNLFHIIKRNKYFSHIDVGYYDGLIIPSQSIFDVRRSKRLGFEMMEFNVRKTSDGVFYAFHGSANCFGDAFQSVDGTDISTVNVSTVTSEYIQSNIRYKSRYAKYQVAPSTLRDVLVECKKNEIIPLVEQGEGVAEFTKSIMGDNLFLLGSYERDRSTLDCGDCVCVSWLTGTAEQVIAKAQKSGGAYVCGINVTNSMYADYTEADWADFIGKIHSAGYFVSCAYQSKAQTQMLLNAGIDIMASHGEINDIEHGNLFDAESNLDYADFTTNGTITDGVLSLSTGQYIEPKGITERPFLGGRSLRVIFSGKIHVKMGRIDEDFEYDGKKTLWFSSQTQQVIPTFLITAVNDTEIAEISFKASKM